MYLLLHSATQSGRIVMEQAGNQTVSIGEHRYQIANLAHSVRKHAQRMWQKALTDDVLDRRFYFEATEGARGMSQWGDSGSFSPANGAMVALGRWDEAGSVAIALHEIAHEMHLRSGGYDDSDGIIREALALLAEREAGMRRSFEREPYHTAANLIEQLSELSAFKSLPFHKRWEEVADLRNEIALADLVNFYVDRSDRLGLGRWLKRYSESEDVRDTLLHRLAITSLRYSLEYRRVLLRNLVRCKPTMPMDRLLAVLDAVSALDQRYPQDDLRRIIEFCFAPVAPPRRRLFAFGTAR